MTNQQSDLEIRRQEIEMGEALRRLEANPDFKKVILDGYIMRTLVEESQYLISMEPSSRQMIIEQIMAVNYLRDYLTSISIDAEGENE